MLIIRELKRKSIHIFGVITIPIDFYFGFFATCALLLSLSSLYVISEYAYKSGRTMPVIHTITKAALRDASDKKTDYSPLLLSSGVIISLALYPDPINYCAIIAVVLGDGFASLVGKPYGRHKLVFNKSMEGTATGFAATFTGCLLFVSPQIALCVAAIAMAIEVIPLGKFDNIVIPVLVGLFLYFCLYLALCNMIIFT